MTGHTGKRNPLQVREALAKLPCFTQRFWTWLTGLTHKDESPRKPWTQGMHVASLLSVFVVAVGLSGWASQSLVGQIARLAI